MSGTSAESAIQRLEESRPPATDAFTYLTIIEKSLSPEILPTLLDILQDEALTRDIGWDLVAMLLDVDGSDACLETVARLGNPREVILKVLEAFGHIEDEFDDDDEETPEELSEDATRKAVTLLGMLGILHKRLKVKAPSRFVHTTLQTVLASYRPNPEMTAAVIDLVRSLAAHSRPVLPSRQSSISLNTPFQSTDPDKSAPDPEADKSAGGADPAELSLTNRLLRSFVTCILSTYVNANRMEWAPRLLEFYHPERLVPGRKTMIQSFKEEESLLGRDRLVGQLVALAGDLGLSNMKPEKITELCKSDPIVTDPLSVEPDPKVPESTKVSTSGFWCLTAYWLFASEVFDGDYDQPAMYIFPDHFDMLKSFLSDDPQGQIARNPGTVDALIGTALWLESQGRIAKEGTKPDFMAYHHLLSLCSVLHHDISIRNAATALAGTILHADPDPEDRLRILEDLLENCVFSSLQACAVTWLREEMVQNQKTKTVGPFTSADSIESLQYALFPNLGFLSEMDSSGFLDYWAENHSFHLQVANFAMFLFTPGGSFAHMVPGGMPAAVEQRYVEPLLEAVKMIKGDVVESAQGPEIAMQLGIIADRLSRLELS